MPVDAALLAALSEPRELVRRAHELQVLELGSEENRDDVVGQCLLLFLHVPIHWSVVRVDVLIAEVDLFEQASLLDQRLLLTPLQSFLFAVSLCLQEVRFEKVFQRESLRIFHAKLGLIDFSRVDEFLRG